MPLTGLAPLDSSWQPARFFVINDRRLQANRVDHRSFAGFSLHNLGSGQQVAAGARRRGGAARIGVLSSFPVVGVRLCVAYFMRTWLATTVEWCLPAGVR